MKESVVPSMPLLKVSDVEIEVTYSDGSFELFTVSADLGPYPVAFKVTQVTRYVGPA